VSTVVETPPAKNDGAEGGKKSRLALLREAGFLAVFLAVYRSYVFRRFFFFLFVIWAASTVIFIIPRLSGQDPVKEKLLLEAQRGGSMQQGLDEIAKSYQARLGLDKPLLTQYRNYMYDIIRFDMGPSISFFPRSVNSMIADSIVWTISLIGTVIILGFLIGTLAGALLGWPKSPGYLQFLFMPFLTLSAIPQYLLGMILAFIFAASLEWLPLFGPYAPGTNPELSIGFIIDLLRHAILPGSALVLSAIGFWAVGMRGMMINNQGEDFMIQAEAKGLKSRRIFFRYGVRNAMLPQITGLALAMGTLLTGALLIERIFVYPGLGDILFQAIRLSDFFVIRGIVLTVIITVAFATFLLDVFYPYLDPRVKYSRG
jgi:peptide/nickel transport system permease protein